VDDLLHRFVAGLYDAFGVWLALVGVVVVMVVVVLRPVWREQTLRMSVRAAAAQLRRSRRQAELHRLRSRARHLAVAAQRALLAARDRRADWLTEGHAAEMAWQAFEAADADARRAIRADAFWRLNHEPGGEELDARRRLLRRLVLDAHALGDVSTWQLCQVLAERDGWSVRRPPADLDGMLRRAVRDHRWNVYRQAVAAERAAWEAAEAARGVQAKLAGEASAASAEVDRVRRAVRDSVRPSRRRTGAAGWRARPAPG
jgi:hypothetical protein